MQPTPDCRPLIAATHALTEGNCVDALPSNERILWNVKKKRRSPKCSALGKAVDCIGTDLPGMPWKAELLPGALSRLRHFVEANRRAQVEDLTAFSCAQYDAVEPRICHEEWEDLLEHPCDASALSTECHSIERDPHQSISSESDGGDQVVSGMARNMVALGTRTPRSHER
jgi:hypothetical protein